MNYEIAQYLLDNKDELKAELDCAHAAPPPKLRDIYKRMYVARGLDIIKSHLGQFNLSPEALYDIITEESVNNILGKEFLCPPSASDIKR